jgi:hypothetical protein
MHHSNLDIEDLFHVNIHEIDKQYLFNMEHIKQ